MFGIKHRNFQISVGFLIILLAANCFVTINGLSIAGDRESRKLFGGYKITPKFCTVVKSSKADSHGPTICMFNHECVERKGEVMGACMDGFLFGTCCKLPGVVETNIKSSDVSSVNNQIDKQSLKPQIVNNNYYQSNADSNESNDIKYGVSNEAAIVSSPSSVFISHDDHANDAIYSSHENNDGSAEKYEPELPNYIYSSSSSSSLEVNDALSNSIHFDEHPFDHSDISHSGADADLVNVNGYPSSTPGDDFMQTEMRTEKPEKTKIPKPIFKLKPTQSSTEKYILVQTISNDNEIHPTKKPSTNDSIHSIMMMLNDTNPGPSYDTIDDSSSPYYAASTPAYESTSSINYSKYGPTSYYITTKVPHRATTVHVPSPNPTRRPVTTTTRFPLVTKSSNKVKESFTKQPQRITTLNVPSTSYLYSPNPVTQRPATKKTTVNKSESKKTTPKPAVTVKKPISNVDNNIVVISGGGVTKNPSPTVHITPKPVTNIMTTSILNDFTKQKKRPANSAGPTDNTVSYSTTPTSFISSSVYVPAIQDFHNEGYFVVTHHPGRPEEHVGSSTAIYTNAIGSDGKPIVLTYDPLKRPSLAETLNEANVDKINIPPMTTDDFSNFPPVRNPNLNMTNTNNIVMDEVDISTPTFVEDEMLDSKMELLVSKIVASLQGNFDNLVDIVYERKNVSTAEHDIGNLNKNGTILKDSISNSTVAAGNKKPTTVRPAVTKPAVTKPAVTKPAKVTVKPTPKPKVTTTRVPAKVTTLAPPGRPGNAQTTKKTPAKATTTTKKPVNKKTTTKPTAAEQTTKKPVRVTQTTKKPSKRVTTTTTPVPVQLDEDDEVEEEGEEEEEEETVVEETENECGVRPQIKTGRIVGGKASAFGEFPWQVLVRESTWLGLFTKNKCGGVLVSNNYVITAAHCQPGFLASLVAVFGEYDISGDLETKRSVSKNVKRVIVHRQYDAATFENDLAILELESPVHYDSHIVPICMPPDSSDFIGKVATVSGWGRLKYGGGVPSVLQEVQVPIIENDVCQEMFATAGHNKKILPSFLCAGYANGQRDSCEGDSGGPLVLQRNDGRYQLIGTVSHGIKCASPLLPGVYMRTTFYKPWLKSITGIK
ncbi:unnamed protein product [Diamesa hyperborea]